MDADLSPTGHRSDRRGTADAAAWDARLSEVGSPRCTVDWLALREPADSVARAHDLPGTYGHLTDEPDNARVIVDVGSGSGSMGRWLAPRLDGPQRWVLHDRDPELLAAARLPDAARDGATVTTETRQGEVTELTADDLDGVSLVTASALLDMLTTTEIDALAGACVDARVPALLTLTVTGGARLHPAEPADAAFAAAFDDHQRRAEQDRHLLGPDAADAAADAFAARGATVHRRETPWRLGATEPGGAALLEEWLRGWIAAACAQDPSLAPGAADYLRRRLDALAAGELRAEIGHADLLAIPA